MTILTSKMKTARQARGADVSSNLKCFFPFNEGSGDSFSDIIGNVKITDDGTSNHDEPHAPTLVTASNTALDAGSWPSISATQSAVIFFVSKLVTLSAFAQVIIGNLPGS